MLAWAATIAEIGLSIALILGFKMRLAAMASSLLLLTFAFAMTAGLGIKAPFDYSVFTACAAALLLALNGSNGLSLDSLLANGRLGSTQGIR